jgi:cellulose synthase/poly-beta-1,6-N-acetylglucosamine synthase-like glycosyltransferase
LRGSDTSSPTSTYSVGICASDSSPELARLVRAVLSEEPRGSRLTKLILVASGCPESTLAPVRQLAEADSRLTLIVEPSRTGKVSAVNRIISASQGDFLVLTNSDATPLRGSIPALIEAIESDRRIGSISALPVFKKESGLTGEILWLVWSSHNISSLKLNHARLSNHNSDELMVVRRCLMSHLPADVVNDGAYIGGLLHKKGYMVNISESARVEIDVPEDVRGLIRQRRRIIYGHVQVWKRLGSPPRTVESLLLTRPGTALDVLRSAMRLRPKSLLVLPVAAVIEMMAFLLSVVDRLTPGSKHVVWRRPGT